MSRLIVVFAAVAALGACAEAPAQPLPGVENECRAADYQSLIGRPKSEIPATPAGETWRVTCSTCPVTMDFNARRMNIFYNQQTGIIEKVTCG